MACLAAEEAGDVVSGNRLVSSFVFSIIIIFIIILVFPLVGEPFHPLLIMIILLVRWVGRGFRPLVSFIILIFIFCLCVGEEDL